MRGATPAASGGIVAVFGGGQRLHRQGMDLLAHPVAERAVDALVSGDPGRALELGRDDGGEEMAPVAFDFDVLARQPVGDEALDLGGGGIGHDGMVARHRAAPEARAIVQLRKCRPLARFWRLGRRRQGKAVQARRIVDADQAKQRRLGNPCVDEVDQIGGLGQRCRPFRMRPVAGPKQPIRAGGEQCVGDRPQVLVPGAADALLRYGAESLTQTRSLDSSSNSNGSTEVSADRPK